jgi:pSer/pThr/pTyr-binding forkhead associated (FHA) protein
MTNELQQEEGMVLTTEEHCQTAGHPHAGISSEGWSSPEADIATPHCQFAKLVLKRGVETDISFPLNPPAIVGRFDPSIGPIDVDLGNLPEGSYVSRKHARFTCEDGVWHVHDLGSSNGTFVLRNDFERVEDAELEDGQEIAFGNARFVFHLTAPETPLAGAV